MTPTQIEQLESYRGRNRVALVFAPSRTDESYLAQERLFRAAEAGLRKRDLLVRYIFLDGPEGDDRTQSCFKVSETSFTVVLIGKDGGEKARFLEPIQPSTLFSLIDQMPLRRREMKRQL